MKYDTLINRSDLTILENIYQTSTLPVSVTSFFKIMKVRNVLIHKFYDTIHKAAS